MRNKPLFRQGLWLMLGAALLWPAWAQGAQNLLLNLPPIQGSSLISGFEGWINIASYQWDADKTPPPLHGSGSGGLAQFDDITVQKFQDAASSNLLYYCAHGLVITQASIVTAISGQYVGRSPIFSRLDLRNAYISGISLNAVSGDNGPASESFQLHFKSQFIWSYAQFTNSVQTGLNYVGGYSSDYNLSNHVAGNLVPFTVSGMNGPASGVTTITWPATPTAVYAIMRSTQLAGPFTFYTEITNDTVSTNLTLNITNTIGTMYFYSVQGQF